jgi:hypothetical protein
MRVVSRATNILQPPNRSDVLRLAAEACVDPRTAARALRGERVRGLAAKRIRHVLSEDPSTPTRPSRNSSGPTCAIEARAKETALP